MQGKGPNGQPFDWGISDDLYWTADFLFDKVRLIFPYCLTKLLLDVANLKNSLDWPEGTAGAA